MTDQPWPGCLGRVTAERAASIPPRLSTRIELARSSATLGTDAEETSVNRSPPALWLSTEHDDTPDHVHGKIRGMEKIIRKSAGVKFESDVLEFVDRIAREQQRSRSFIINSILRWYGKWLVEQKPKVETEKQVPVIRL
jgi:hypothetical protein